MAIALNGAAIGVRERRVAEGVDRLTGLLVPGEALATDVVTKATSDASIRHSITTASTFCRALKAGLRRK